MGLIGGCRPDVGNSCSHGKLKWGRKMMCCKGSSPTWLVGGVLSSWSLGSSSVLRTWQLTSCTARDSREQMRSHNTLYELSLEVTLCHLLNILLVTQVSPVCCGRGLHKVMHTWRWELSWRLAFTLVCGPCSVEQDLNILNIGVTGCQLHIPVPLEAFVVVTPMASDFISIYKS